MEKDLETRQARQASLAHQIPKATRRFIIGAALSFIFISLASDSFGLGGRDGRGLLKSFSMEAESISGKQDEFSWTKVIPKSFHQDLY